MKVNGKDYPFFIMEKIFQTNWLFMDIYGDNPLVIYGLSS